MAEAITTDGFRQRLALQACNGTQVKAAAQMAFGDGGHNPDGTPKTGNSTQTTLQNELYRKALDTVIQEDLYSATGTGILLKAEMVGETISEAGLLDGDGNLMGFRNFAPKIKEDDETYEISIKVKF